MKSTKNMQAKGLKVAVTELTPVDHFDFHGDSFSKTIVEPFSKKIKDLFYLDHSKIQVNNINNLFLLLSLQS